MNLLHSKDAAQSTKGHFGFLSPLGVKAHSPRMKHNFRSWAVVHGAIVMFSATLFIHKTCCSTLIPKYILVANKEVSKMYKMYG